MMPVGRETMRGTLGSWSSSRRASIRRALGALEIHANLGLWCPLGSALTRPAAALLEASPEDHRDHHRSGYTDIYIFCAFRESRCDLDEPFRADGLREVLLETPFFFHFSSSLLSSGALRRRRRRRARARDRAGSKRRPTDRCGIPVRRECRTLDAMVRARTPRAVLWDVDTIDIVPIGLGNV